MSSRTRTQTVWPTKQVPSKRTPAGGKVVSATGGTSTSDASSNIGLVIGYAENILLTEKTDGVLYIIEGYVR